MTNQQKTAVISGGTRGIGLAIATALAGLGYNIATFARTQNQLDAFGGKMDGLGVKTFSLCGDARDDKFLEKFVVQAISTLGGIKVLINNAGGGKKDNVLDAKNADWDQILSVNLRAAMILTKLVLPELIKSPRSAVINIASMAGKTGIAGSTAYCASKFGIVGFSHALFEDVRHHGVKVCAICPGYVDTPLIPSRKALIREEMIRPEDIAKTVEYVLGTSPSACPVEILLRPQRYPFKQ